MKKVIVLAVLCSISMWAQTVMAQSVPQPAINPTQDNTATNDHVNDIDASTQPDTLNTSPEADKIGTGSGDDVDTENEADPANDKDPEADVGAGQGS